MRRLLVRATVKQCPNDPHTRWLRGCFVVRLPCIGIKLPPLSPTLQARLALMRTLYGPHDAEARKKVRSVRRGEGGACVVKTGNSSDERCRVAGKEQRVTGNGGTFDALTTRRACARVGSGPIPDLAHSPSSEPSSSSAHGIWVGASSALRLTRSRSHVARLLSLCVCVTESQVRSEGGVGEDGGGGKGGPCVLPVPFATVPLVFCSTARRGT